MNNGGPAFPRPLADAVGDALFSKLRDRGAPGMTLRDYFAAAALTGLVMSHDKDFKLESPSMEDAYADAAYRIADAMLTQRGGQDDKQ